MKHRYRRRLDKLTMFQSGEKFPKLRGKASEIQSLALDIVEEQNEYREWPSSPDWFFLKFNVEVDTILNDFHPRYGLLAVPLQEATQLYSRGMQMAQIHCQLITFYKGQGIKLLIWLARLILSSIAFSMPDGYTHHWSGVKKVKTRCSGWQGCGKVAWMAASTGRQPRELFGRNAICFFCVTKLAEEKRRLCAEFYFTCVKFMTTTSLPSLLVWPFSTSHTCVLLHVGCY